MMARLEHQLCEFTENGLESFLISGRDGLPISSMAFQRAWGIARESIGRTDLPFHDLRHTGLTLSAATGASTAELARWAGHASPDEAFRYRHSTLERDNIGEQIRCALSILHGITANCLL
jgi:integrase